VKKLRKNAKGRSAKLRQCYVYEIRVDGVVRYIGKGCNDRVYSHLIEAKRTASRPGVKVRNLSPHFRKMLVCAVRRGSIITEKIISSKLTDAEAYAMEWQMIWDYHKRHAGQLWNTIDERGRNREDLPNEWSNPVYPLYRLPRPFNKLPNGSMPPSEGRTATKRMELDGRNRTITRLASVSKMPFGHADVRSGR
jgi:LEM3-like protein